MFLEVKLHHILYWTLSFFFFGGGGHRQLVCRIFPLFFLYISTTGRAKDGGVGECINRNGWSLLQQAQQV